MADDSNTVDTQGDTQTLSPTDGLTRSEFLKKTAGTLGFGAIMGGLIAVPVTGMALAPAVTGPDWEPLDAGPVDDFAEGSYTKVILYPGKGENGAYVRERVAFVRRNADNFTDTLTGTKGGFTVISNRCAHLGCPVQNSADSFVCPCHGGAYDKEGARTGGPPVRPLDRFDYKVKAIGGADHLIITGEYSLTNDGKRKKLRGPGQHSGGPEGLLYPLQP